MKKYMSVQVTISKDSCLHGARIYYSDEELGLELCHTVGYEQGMKELRRLEKRLGRVAKLVINRYNPKIAYKELYGFLDRE